MSKDQVSRNYIEEQKAAHAWKPHLELQDRLALVTGAGKKGSIGEAIVTALVEEQMNVWHPPIAELDLASSCSIGDYFSKNKTPFDTLICSHGVNWLDWIEDQPYSRIAEVVQINLIATMALVGEFVNHTIELSARKQIVLIGSMAYNHVLNGSAPYCASKAGLAMFARCAAWELAPKGYDVFILHPSNTEGAPMSEDTIQGLMRYRGLSRAEAEAYWAASLPREKWLQPEDIARNVVHLLREPSGYLSGAQLELGGGQR